MRDIANIAVAALVVLVVVILVFFRSAIQHTYSGIQKWMQETIADAMTPEELSQPAPNAPVDFLLPRNATDGTTTDI